MNEHALIKLGYYEIISELENHVSSNLGRKKVKAMKPLKNIDVIKRMLVETEEAMLILDAMSNTPLYGLSDVTTIIDRMKMGAVLDPEDLLLLADLLRGMRLTKKKLMSFEFQAPHLSNYAVPLIDLKSIEDEIHEAIQGQYVSSNASKELNRIRRQIGVVENRIETRLNKIIKSNEYSKYIQDPVIQKKNGTFVIPVKSAYKNMIPGRAVEISSTGVTTYICPDSVEKLIKEILLLKQEEELEIYQVLSILTGLIFEEVDNIISAVGILGELDWIFSRAKFSMAIGGNKPEYHKNEIVDLKQARHPLMKEECIANHLLLGKDYRGLLITGPNTGGKTMTLKTMGLNILLAQTGILPAIGKDSHLSVFKEVFVDIGDDQDFKQSLSTFSAHLTNLKIIIEKAQRHSLCLIDEIGTGTDPREGAALGISILTELYEKGALVIATSHYGELKDFAEYHRDFINASMSFDEATLAPKYHLIYDTFGRSNGINVAKMLSIESKVILRAQRLLKSDRTIDIYQSMPLKKFVNKKELEKTVYDTDLQKGDQVIQLETGKKCLVYETFKSRPFVKVLVDDEFVEIHLRRVKRTFTRDELYPEGYDLDQLFIPFYKRKLERDIQKKRVYKEKEIKSKMKSTEK